MSVNLHCLKGNLQILYAAAHCYTEEPILSADLSGTNLLLKGVGLTSWVCSQVYEKSTWLGCENQEQEKIQSALLYTRSIFSKEQELAITAQMDYQALIKSSIRNEQVPNERYRAARETLSAWHLATNEWTKFLKSKESKGIRVWLNAFSLEMLNEPRFFSSEALNESTRLRQFFKVIFVESRLQMPFAPILFKAACSLPFEDNDLRDLEALSHKIDKHSELMGVRTFEKALKKLNEIFKTENDASSLISMKMALFFNAKCEIFCQKDEKHFVWRNALTRGDSVFFGERELILGEQLGKQIEPEKDLNRVFTVVDDDSIVLSFAVNRALYDLRTQALENYSCILKPVKYLDVEAKGRFAIVEKLVDPITSIQWQSQRELVKKDEKNATAIAGLFKWLLEHNKMFLNFSADNIMFNEDGRLTYLKLPMEGPLNFNALVQFAIECSHGNLPVYKFLTHKLKDHPFAVFYEKMVENALKEIPDDASNFAAVLNDRLFFQNYPFIKNIFEPAKSLHEQIKEIKSACFKQIKKTYNISERKDVPEIIASEILSCYKNAGHIGILPDNFELEVLKLVRQKL